MVSGGPSLRQASASLADSQSRSIAKRCKVERISGGKREGGELLLPGARNLPCLRKGSASSTNEEGGELLLPGARNLPCLRKGSASSTNEVGGEVLLPGASPALPK